MTKEEILAKVAAGEIPVEEASKLLESQKVPIRDYQCLIAKCM